MANVEGQLPSVGIVIANHNYSKYVKRAIASAVRQDYPNFIVAVVDDASTDNSVELIKELISADGIFEEKNDNENGQSFVGSYNNRYVLLWALNKNKGPSQARNVAISSLLHQCHIIAILDADDEMYPTKISKCVAKMIEDPARIGAIYTDTLNFNEETGVTMREFREPFDSLRLAQGHNQVCSQMVLSRIALQECGLYDHNLFLAEDLDLILRIAQKFALVHIPETLSMQRIHGNNLSGSQNIERYNQAWQYISQKYRANAK